MKYTNHLNAIIAIIGVIVITQTLTRTFWSSSPEKQFSVDVPATQPKIQIQAPRPAAGQRRAGQGPRMLPGTVGVPSSSGNPAAGSDLAGRNRLLSPATQPNTDSGIVGAPPSATVAAPNTVTIPSGPTTADPSGSGVRGDMAGRSVRGSPFTRGRSIYGQQREANARQMNLPPPGTNDAAKRRPDENAPAPPVRSSMPEQRVQ